MSQKESEWERKLLDLVDNKEAGYMDFSELIQETLSNREKEIAEEVSDELTVNLDKSVMLDGWEKYWLDAQNGKYIEGCVECENSKRINKVLQILKHQ